MTALVTPRHHVAPNAIPDALRKIWRECCQGDEDNSVSRALITNLVAVVTADRERTLRALLESLSARLPCRAFLVVVSPGDGAIRSEVHGAARLHGTIRDLVLEQIELTVPEASFARVAGLVRPLLISDIPTRLYWGAPWPSDPRRFDSLASMAELSILDSSRFLLPASDLDALEKAASFKRYIAQWNCTQDELAKRLSVDRSTVANLIRLLELPEAVQRKLRAGSISMGHARALLPLGDEDEQVRIADLGPAAP